MKKYLIIILLLFAFSAYCQSYIKGKLNYPFFESFEYDSLTGSGWTQIKTGDVEWETWGCSYYRDYSAYISYSADTGDGQGHWLISPRISLGINDSLSFWIANTQTSAYPPDSLIVYISEYPDKENFYANTLLSIDVTSLPINFEKPEFVRFSVSLNSFSNKTVYIAFKHYDFDGNGCYLDGVHISNTYFNEPYSGRCGK